MLVLTVTAGPEPGRNLELSGDRPLIFGRYSVIGSEVDPKLSRRHAQFRHDNHCWTVQDLGSRNGTFVNGEQIHEARRLRNGDEVRMGRTMLSVALIGELELPEPTPAAAPAKAAVARPVAPSKPAAPAKPVAPVKAAEPAKTAIRTALAKTPTPTPRPKPAAAVPPAPPIELEPAIEAELAEPAPVREESPVAGPIGAEVPPMPVDRPETPIDSRAVAPEAVILDDSDLMDLRSPTAAVLESQQDIDADLIDIAQELGEAAMAPVSDASAMMHGPDDVLTADVDDTLVAGAMVGAAPLPVPSRPGDESRGATREPRAERDEIVAVAQPEVTPTPARPAPRGRTQGKRWARYAVVGVLLLVAGVTAAFMIQSFGEDRRLRLTQDENVDAAAQVSDANPPAVSQPEPPATATPPAPAPKPDAMAARPTPPTNVTPPPPVIPVAPKPATPTPTPAPAASQAKPSVTQDEAANLPDPFRQVDSLASAMASGGRVSSKLPEPSTPATPPEPPQAPTNGSPPTPTASAPAAATPLTPVAVAPPLPDLPRTTPLVEKQIGVVQPPIDDPALDEPAAPTTPDTPPAPRPTGPRTRPAPIDDAQRVVFVVDASGSMVDTLPLVIQELDRIIAQLRPEQRFTVLFYQKDQVIEVEPEGMKEASRRNKVLVSRWMDPKAGHVFAVGPSYPLDAIKTAITYQPDQIFLLADKVGMSVQAKEQTQKFMGELEGLNPQRAIQVNAVHFFYPDPNQTLASVASTHLGTYRFVSLEEVGSNAAQPAGDPLRDSLMLLLEGKQ